LKNFLGKIVVWFVLCTDRLDLFKNSNSLNVQIRGISMENCVLMYYSSRYDENFEIVKCTKSQNLKGKSKNIRNREN